MATVALGSKAGKWIMVSSIMASAMAFIDSTALNVVLPSLQKNLNASGTDLFWILNAYLLMLAALILIGGALGDLVNKMVFGQTKKACNHLIYRLLIYLLSKLAVREEPVFPSFFRVFYIV